MSSQNAINAKVCANRSVMLYMYRVKYVFIHVCIYVCMYAYTYIYIVIYVNVYVYVYVHVLICMYAIDLCINAGLCAERL